MKKVVKTITAVKACRNHVGKISQLARLMSEPSPPQSLPTLLRPEGSSGGNNLNPCVDLYFRSPVMRFVSEDPRSVSEYHETLMKQLLPRAWSNNPLTTLKLICNLLLFEDGAKFDSEAFYVAAVWLHQNHPKTLACNLLPIAGYSESNISDIVEILSRVGNHRQVDDDDDDIDHDYVMTWTRRDKNKHYTRYPYPNYNPLISSPRNIRAKEKASALLKRRKMIVMANKVAERYDCDPDYRFLHEQVSDFMAECLKYDIQEFNKFKHKQQLMEQQGEGEGEVLELSITDAATWCPSMPNSSMGSRPTDLLYESIASKVFPPSQQSKKSKSNPPMSLLGQRLRKEVLVPLKQALSPYRGRDGANPWGYHSVTLTRHFLIRKYLLALKEAIDIATANSESFESEDSVSKMIDVGALLPHEIILYSSAELKQAAELQWERMVEDLHHKQGKLNKCLAVCNVDGHAGSMSAALGLLVSQLNNQEPWKGKMMSYARNPQLYSIPPPRGKNLRWKRRFMMSWKEKCEEKGWEEEVGLVKKVFDLILEVAVKENLKPEQMINKVYVFKDEYYHEHHGRRLVFGDDFEEIQRGFEAKGFTVPHLMIWNMIPKWSDLPVISVQPGLTTLTSGSSKHLIKAFLDNDGEIGPEQIMEAAISCNECYQNLAIVD